MDSVIVFVQSPTVSTQGVAAASGARLDVSNAPGINAAASTASVSSGHGNASEETSSAAVTSKVVSDSRLLYESCFDRCKCYPQLL